MVKKWHISRIQVCHWYSYQNILTSSEIYNWTKVYDGVAWPGLNMNFGNAIFSANGILFPPY